jgi:hypothetical protein
LASAYNEPEIHRQNLRHVPYRKRLQRFFCCLIVFVPAGTYLSNRYATPEHRDTLKTHDWPILIKQKKSKKREDSVEIGTDYEH